MSVALIPDSSAQNPLSVYVGNLKQLAMFNGVPDGVLFYPTTTAGSNVIGNYTFSTSDIGKVMCVPNSGPFLPWTLTGSGPTSGGVPGMLLGKIAAVSGGNAIITDLDGIPIQATASGMQQGYFGTDNSFSGGNPATDEPDSQGGYNALQYAIDRGGKIRIGNPKSLSTPVSPAIYCFSTGVTSIHGNALLEGDGIHNTKLVFMCQEPGITLYANPDTTLNEDWTKPGVRDMQIITTSGDGILLNYSTTSCQLDAQGNVLGTWADSIPANASRQTYIYQVDFTNLHLRGFMTSAQDPDYRKPIPSAMDQGALITEYYTRFGAGLHCGYRSIMVQVSNVVVQGFGIGLWADGANSLHVRNGRFYMNGLNVVAASIWGGTNNNPCNEGDSFVIDGGRIEEPGRCGFVGYNCGPHLFNIFYEDAATGGSGPMCIRTRGCYGDIYADSNFGNSTYGSIAQPDFSLQGWGPTVFRNNYWGVSGTPEHLQPGFEIIHGGNRGFPMVRFADNQGIDPRQVRNFVNLDSGGNYLPPVVGPAPALIGEFDDFHWNVHSNANEYGGDNNFFFRLNPASNSPQYETRTDLGMSNGVPTVRFFLREPSVTRYKLTYRVRSTGVGTPTFWLAAYDKIDTVTHTLTPGDDTNGFKPAGSRVYVCAATFTDTNTPAWPNPNFTDASTLQPGYFIQGYGPYTPVKFHPQDVAAKRPLSLVVLDSTPEAFIVPTGNITTQYQTFELIINLANAPFNDPYIKTRSIELSWDPSTIVFDASENAGIKLEPVYTVYGSNGLLKPDYGVELLNSMQGAVTLTGAHGLTAAAGASGTITIDTPQDLQVTASPSFTGLTATGLFTHSGQSVSIGSPAAWRAAIDTPATENTTFLNGLFGPVTLSGLHGLKVATASSGSLTIDTPQDLQPTASPTFAALTTAGAVSGASVNALSVTAGSLTGDGTGLTNVTAVNSAKLNNQSASFYLDTSATSQTKAGPLSITGALTAASFNGSGAGLTGSASNLSIGGNAATATTAAQLNGEAASYYVDTSAGPQTKTGRLCLLAGYDTNNNLTTGGLQVGIGPSGTYPVDVQVHTANSIAARFNASYTNAASNNTQVRFAGGKALSTGVLNGELWAIGTDVAAGNGSQDFHLLDLVGSTYITLQSGTGNMLLPGNSFSPGVNANAALQIGKAGGSNYGGGIILRDNSTYGGIWTQGNGNTLALAAGGTVSGFSANAVLIGSDGSVTIPGSVPINPNIQLGGAIKSVTRDLRQILAEAVSITSLGITGSTAASPKDEATAVAAAFQAAVANGGWLSVPAGLTIYLGSSVSVPSGLRLVGDGWSRSRFLRMASLPNGVGLFDFPSGTSNVEFLNIGIDSQTGDNVTGALVGTQRITDGSQSPDPSNNFWTQNSSVWIHYGCSNIVFDGVDISHSGGFPFFAQAISGGNITRLTLRRCSFRNNRAFLGTNGALDVDHATIGSSVLFYNDGTTAYLQDVTVEDCYWQNCVGNACCWSHIGSTANPSYNNRNFVFTGNVLDDILLDATQWAGLAGLIETNNTVRRFGFRCLTDNASDRTPYWGVTIPVAFDTAGYLTNAVRSNNWAMGQGEMYDLDGCGKSTISNNVFISAWVTDDPLVNVALLGQRAWNGGSWAPNGINGCIFANCGNTNQLATVNTYLNFTGNEIYGSNWGAFRLYGSQHCLVANNLIYYDNAHPAGWLSPIVVGNVAGGFHGTDNDVRGNAIHWANSSGNAVAEDPNISYGGTAFTSADCNRIAPDNKYIGCNGFAKDPNSGSSNGYLAFQSVTVGAANLIEYHVQTEGMLGTGSDAQLKFYSNVSLLGWYGGVYYPVNAAILDSRSGNYQNCHVQMVINSPGGTTATSAPAWTSSLNQTTQDGGVTWKDMGPLSSWSNQNWAGSLSPTGAYFPAVNILPQGASTAIAGIDPLGNVTGNSFNIITPARWQPNHTYTSSARVLDSNGNIQVADQYANGVSSATEPTWSQTVLGITQDGSTQTGITWSCIGPPQSAIDYNQNLRATNLAINGATAIDFARNGTFSLLSAGASVNAGWGYNVGGNAVLSPTGNSCDAHLRSISIGTYGGSPVAWQGVDGIPNAGLVIDHNGNVVASSLTAYAGADNSNSVLSIYAQAGVNLLTLKTESLNGTGTAGACTLGYWVNGNTWGTTYIPGTVKVDTLQAATYAPSSLAATGAITAVGTIGIGANPGVPNGQIDARFQLLASDVITHTVDTGTYLVVGVNTGSGVTCGGLTVNSPGSATIGSGGLTVNCGNNGGGSYAINTTGGINSGGVWINGTQVLTNALVLQNVSFAGTLTGTVNTSNGVTCGGLTVSTTGSATIGTGGLTVNATLNGPATFAIATPGGINSAGGFWVGGTQVLTATRVLQNVTLSGVTFGATTFTGNVTLTGGSGVVASAGVQGTGFNIGNSSGGFMYNGGAGYLFVSGGSIAMTRNPPGGSTPYIQFFGGICVTNPAS